jgi:hypothetical protein
MPAKRQAEASIKPCMKSGMDDRISGPLEGLNHQCQGYKLMHSLSSDSLDPLGVEHVRKLNC